MREQKPEAEQEERRPLGPPVFALSRHRVFSNDDPKRPADVVTDHRKRSAIKPGATFSAHGGQVYSVERDGSLRRQDRVRGISKKKRIRLRREAAAAALTLNAVDGV